MAEPESGETERASGTEGSPSCTGGARSSAAARPPLSPAAERALKEAAERRAKADADAAAGTQRAELGGRNGPEPTRYGDWEKGGIVSDF